MTIGMSTESRNLSGSWTGFTRFTLLNGTLPKGYMWSVERLTKIRTTSRPDHEWPDAWTRIGKAGQKKRKTRMGNRETKIRTARKLRRIYSIDPSDEEYKDNIKNARRKLDTPKAAAMPCKRAFSQACVRETIVSKLDKTKASEAKTGFDCITEVHESTRQRIESVTKRIHEEHIAGKGQNSVSHYNLVHEFIPMSQAMKIPDTQAAVDKEWKSLRPSQHGM